MTEQSDTTNHGYQTPSQGAQDWHVPLNENFERLEIDVELRDVAANRSSYEPADGAKFLELDTGIVYVGDGDSWTPTLAMAYFDADGELVCGELTDCLGSDDDQLSWSGRLPAVGVNATAAHDGAIVFGDSTQRSIWSRRANEVRSQMPFHAPSFETDGVAVSDASIEADEAVEADRLDGGSIRGDSLEAGALAVDGDELTITLYDDDPDVTVGDGVFSNMPMYAPSFNTTSARSAKTDLQPVDPQHALDGVRSLEISTWRLVDDDGGRHMGPMAGDFQESFDLGGDDDTIATVDADGVALAAIQGLADRLDALEAENQALKAQVSALEDEAAREPASGR